MTEELTQIIKRELAKLPEEHRRAIESLSWESITAEVGKIHLLTNEEITALQTEVLIGLIGLTYPATFVTDIEDNVGTTKEEANKIANELGEKIFYPVILGVEEAAKDKIEKSNLNWKDNVSFVLSGGNYSALLKKPEGGSGDGPPTDQKV